MNSNFHHHAINAIRPTAYHIASKNKNSLSVSSPISSRAFHANVNYYNNNGNGNGCNKHKSYVDCINESISFLKNCSCTHQSTKHKLSSSQSSRKHNMLHNSSSNSSYDKLSKVIVENNQLLHSKKQLEKEIEKAEHKMRINGSNTNINDEYKTYYHSNNNNKHNYYHNNQHQNTQSDNDEYIKLSKSNKKLHKKKKILEHCINIYINNINSLDHNWVDMFSNSNYIYDKLKDTVAPMKELITLFSRVSSTINTSNSTLSSPNTLQNNSTSNNNNNK